GMFVTALAVLAGLPPSQLISRRPEGNVPTLGLSVPRVLRKLSTVDWMAWMGVGLVPAAEKTMGSARAGAERADSRRQAIAALGENLGMETSCCVGQSCQTLRRALVPTPLLVPVPAKPPLSVTVRPGPGSV